MELKAVADSGPRESLALESPQMVDRLHTLGLDFVFNDPGNEIIKDVLRRARVKKGQRFSFGCLLTRFLRGYQIEEVLVDYRPRNDLNGLIVKPRFEEPLDDDDATDKEQCRVDSDLKSMMMR
ncbi:hypothetical protein HAX54_034990 [Datura stramonium]|uniref:Uncharacterized protein n=1 Tax=Datura stramonium TaxID=4076 RepID=A0ABS8VIF5_DATST|nr:hypothetical protein [Datura stramonium]